MPAVVYPVSLRMGPEASFSAKVSVAGSNPAVSSTNTITKE